VPGLIAALGFMAWIAWSVSRNPGLAPERPEPVGTGAALRALMAIWPIALLMLAVLGTLFAGLATPTESAGMGVLAAVIIGVTVGDLRPAGLLDALMRATATFATIGMVFLGAVILAQSISVLGLPQQLLAPDRRHRHPAARPASSWWCSSTSRSARSSTGSR
jgi:C4-dicarboxylate transporter, DctM subunit